MERRGREYHGSNSLLLLLLLFLCSFFFPHPRQLVSQHFTLQSFTRLKTGLLPLHNRCSTFLYPTGEIQEETCEEVEITIYPFLLENISLIVRFSLRYFLLLRFPPLFHCLTIDGDGVIMDEGRVERKKEWKKKKNCLFPSKRRRWRKEPSTCTLSSVVTSPACLCGASFSLSLEHRKLRFLRNSEASYLSVWKEEGVRQKKREINNYYKYLFD